MRYMDIACHLFFPGTLLKQFIVTLAATNNANSCDLICTSDAEEDNNNNNNNNLSHSYKHNGGEKMNTTNITLNNINSNNKQQQHFQTRIKTAW